MSELEQAALIAVRDCLGLQWTERLLIHLGTSSRSAGEHAMHNDRQDVPTFSRRWSVAGIAAGAIAIAGAALVWHGHARAFGPGPHRLGGWEQVDPEAMGRRIEAMTAFRMADIDATPEQKGRIAGVMKAAAQDLAPLREQGRELQRQMGQLHLQGRHIQAAHQLDYLPACGLLRLNLCEESPLFSP